MGSHLRDLLEDVTDGHLASEPVPLLDEVALRVGNADGRSSLRRAAATCVRGPVA